jgi:hypothetical protein
MLNPRWRLVVYSLLTVAGVWLIAVVGYSLLKNSRATVEKVKTYVSGTDLSRLSGEERARAIRRLEDMLNSLSMEERQRARLERLAWGWFNDMSEEEKTGFIEATMPTGFKQMITAFEQLPEDRRRRTINDALRRLREEQGRLPGPDGEMSPGDTNRPPVVSEELQAKIRTIGLQAFYSQSSAQTKAELAPVLEELQRAMESGRPFRGR